MMTRSSRDEGMHNRIAHGSSSSKGERHVEPAIPFSMSIPLIRWWAVYGHALLRQDRSSGKMGAAAPAEAYERTKGTMLEGILALSYFVLDNIKCSQLSMLESRESELACLCVDAELVAAVALWNDDNVVAIEEYPEVAFGGSLPTFAIWEVASPDGFIVKGTLGALSVDIFLGELDDALAASTNQVWEVRMANRVDASYVRLVAILTGGVFFV
ncbi:MAG: hypothetical protein EPO39_16255 [Candidatus Manganitrophaceae bacterium]|nr:MAG: hypothetical protein EPO39_16255 [Candidatus Manganitrophaceae bacterium]